MAAKKRRKLPEEDLEASIQDILHSPITRVNLAFLRTGLTEPAGQETTPAAADVAEGPASEPMGFDSEQAVLSAKTSTFDAVFDSKPIGSDPKRGGFEPSPMGSELSPARTLWRAEHLGTFFEASRIRPIHKAQDALSTAEQRVYDLLWAAGAQNQPTHRLVHFSLQRISTQSKLNIKTVRELLPRLMEKGFIAVEQEADVRRNIATLYRVWSCETVLAEQLSQGRRWIVKTGRGVFYAHQMTVSVTGGAGN
jgi:predicted transcriptional regulator